MDKILIYGAGEGGKHLVEEIKSTKEPYEIVGFIDRKGGDLKHGLNVYYPDDIKELEFDYIFVAVDDNKVKDNLIEQYGVSPTKINVERYRNGIAVAVRVKALEHLKEIFSDYGICGSMAEVGVYQGDFAMHMNRLFPDNTLYLYDTFMGFSDADLDRPEEDGSEMKNYKHYAETSEEIVLNKMVNRDSCVICKGLFPDTAKGQDEKYSFVNLDADLYNPILEGLKYFYPRMAGGGVIFIHDYFNPNCPGVKQAVREFVDEYKIGFVPLGDYLTVSISKPFTE